MQNEIKQFIENQIGSLRASVYSYIDLKIREHLHNGLEAMQVYSADLFGEVPRSIPLRPATVATTGNTDEYIIAPIDGRLAEVLFSGVDALAANDTNYVTFSVTNLGQDGSGSTAMLAATDENTTKATGGTALSANTKRTLAITGTANNSEVKSGDRLRVRVAATNTLANTITFPTFLLKFI